MMLTVHLIRHAESEGNIRPHLIGGQSNHLPLTPRGIIQAEKLGQRLTQENWHFDQVFSSTAVRTQETAKAMSKHYSVDFSKISLSSKLLELSHGEWEGALREEKFTPDVRAKIAANPLDFASPGGETQREVRARMFDWLSEVLEAWDGKTPQSVAAFSHGFAIRSLLGHILGANGLMARHIVTHNTSITTLRFRQEVWLVERVNDFSHLSGTDFMDHY